MGKPAARMGDTSAHGGTIILGNPTLLVGKMPVSTMGDMHVCPMCTGPVPHVGGPITLGSVGVLMGKKPGARISDISVCVGPPSMPVVGCFTVLIGEVGSGSQAGSAAAAAAAQAAKALGPKGIEAFPLSEPPGPVEAHDIQIEFTDSAGKPLSGVVYHIKDPDSKDIVGASTLDGKAYHDGYAAKGKFELTVKTLADLKWGKAESGMKEAIPFSAKADAFEDGVEAAVMIFEECGGERRLLESLQLKVSGEKISGEWKWKKSYLPPEGSGPKSDSPVYTFQIVAGGLVGVSGPLKLKDTLTVKVTDPEGTAKKQLDYEIHLANGQLKTGALDDSGKVSVADLAPGYYKVRLVNLKGKEGTPADAPEAKPKHTYVGFGGAEEKEHPEGQDEENKSAIGSNPGPAPKNASAGFGDLKLIEQQAELEQKEKEKSPISGKKLKFPLKTRPIQSYHTGARRFGTPRKGGQKKDRLHGGCDLYAPVGTEVYSVAAGTILGVNPFYKGTWEVTVDHGTFTVRYGELKEDLIREIKVGAVVEKGTLLGHVGKLSGLNLSMVHFELYDGSGKGKLSDHFNPPYYRRKDLLDPTTFLDEMEI